MATKPQRLQKNAQIEHYQSRLLKACIERMDTGKIEGVKEGTTNLFEKVTVSNYRLGRTLERIRADFLMPFYDRMDREDAECTWVRNIINNLEFTKDSDPARLIFRNKKREELKYRN